MIQGVQGSGSPFENNMNIPENLGTSISIYFHSGFSRNDQGGDATVNHENICI